MEISLAAVQIAHTVVNNTKFPKTTSYFDVAKELKQNGHWNLIVACNDKRVTDAFVFEELPEAIEKLFALYPEIRRKYAGWHSQPYIRE